MIKNIKNKKLIHPKYTLKDYLKKTIVKYISPYMCVENHSYSTLQDQRKQIIKYNKSINHKNNYFLYKKVLFTHNIEKNRTKSKYIKN